jgi:hypothetical protein
MTRIRVRRPADVRRLRFPPSHWDTVWAAWCPTCEQESMPLSTGCCGFCDTNLAGQPTRGPYDQPLIGPYRESTIHDLHLAA